MRLDGQTLQRGLVVLGFDPGPLDGIIGERTLAAFDAFLDNVRAPFGTIRTAEDQRSAEIDPEDLAVKLDEAAARYVAPERSERRSSGGALVPEGPSSIAPATFWRASNPWAWGAALVPLALFLGGFGFFLTRTRKR